MTYLRKKVLGNLGEFLTIYLLKSKGHLIRKVNYLTKYGEIDIVTQKDNNLFFVESKLTTSSGQFVLDSWFKSQSNRLHKSIKVFLLEHSQYKDYSYCILFNHLDFSERGFVTVNSYIINS